jgi:hypothetical protein
MRLLRAFEVPRPGRDGVFRVPVVRTILSAVVLVGGCGALLGFGWREPEWVLVGAAGCFLVGLLLLRRFVLAPWTKTGEASRHEQETRLLELAESGRTTEAISLARRICGWDLARAKAFMADLLSRDRGRAA